jgi:drug/metabolite transporter (DMT)-like permease
MLLATTLFWGGGSVVTVLALRDASALWVTALRFTLAALFFAPWALRAGRPTRAEVRAALALGSASALIYTLNALGLMTTDVGRASFLTGSYVLFTPLCAGLLGIERPGWRQLGGALLGVVGLALISNAGAGGLGRGDLFILGSAVAIAAQILISDRVTGRHDALRLSALQMVVVAAWTLPAALIFDGRPRLAGGGALAAIGYLAVLGTDVAFCLQLYAQRRLGPTTTSILLLLEAPFGALAGAIVLGDRMGPIELVGAGLLLAASALASVPAEPLPVTPGAARPLSARRLAEAAHWVRDRIVLRDAVNKEAS